MFACARRWFCRLLLDSMEEREESSNPGGQLVGDDERVLLGNLLLPGALVVEAAAVGVGVAVRHSSAAHLNPQPLLPDAAPVRRQSLRAAFCAADEDDATATGTTALILAFFVVVSATPTSSRSLLAAAASSTASLSAECSR